MLLELNESKLIIYQEYMKKMKDMAEETKMMENNMKTFASQIKNIGNNP